MIALCGAAVVLASCAPGEDDHAERGEAATPSAAEIDPEVAAAVVGVYERVRTLQSEAVSGTRSFEDAEKAIEPLVGDALLQSLVEEFDFYEEEGIIHQGDPVSEPEVTALVDGDPAVATLVDCWDTTAVDVLDEATGESVKAPEQDERVPVTVRAEQAAGGWTLVELNTDFDRPC
jgi:hypothetical protein